MNRPIQHLRSQAVAYFALFVALGGTSYAALSIPRNSIGTRQLRNGAVTANKLAKGSVIPAKLDSRSIAGTVVFWAQIAQNGQVIRSSQPASTSGWSGGIGTVMFHRQVSPRCFALGNALAIGATGSVSLLPHSSIAGKGAVSVFMTPAGSTQVGPLPVELAVICPT